MKFLCFDDWIWLRTSKNKYKPCLLLNLSIFNRMEEGVVCGREVGGKGIYLLYSTFKRDKSKKWVTDHGKHHFGFPVNNSTYQRVKIQKKVLAQNSKKRQGGTPRIFSLFWPKNFLWDLYVLTIGSDWGTLKKVRIDVCCSISRF